jgi:hypothetical protein
MKRFALAVLLCIGAIAPAFADEPSGFRLWPRCLSLPLNCPSVGGTADDYCRKPFPCLAPLAYCAGADDYCRKAMPCLTDVSRCGSVDDYCKKCMPCLVCPPVWPFSCFGR